jgi:SAM-dependent methyltransferase
MPSRRSFLTLVAAAAALKSAAARAQERFSPFVGSNPENVSRMVDLAAPRAGETVIDLGSGDGRIVFAATQNRPGVRGIGVDINPELVAKANAAAKEQKLADRVQFLHQNVFDADLSKVDVIFMWLFPELMRLLRPKILREARPGTRLVAATWDMGPWWPADTTDDPPGAFMTIRQWIVPARVEGSWEWEISLRERSYRFEALLEQRMQQAEGQIRVGNRRELLQNLTLRAAALSFTTQITLPGTGYARLSFNGNVQGDAIEGMVEAQIPKRGEDNETETVRLPWRARRGSGGGYFAPTGTSLN